MNVAALRHPLAPFALATLSPVPFLLLGGFLGVPWLVPAFLWLTVVKLAADRLLPESFGLPAEQPVTPGPSGTVAAGPAGEAAAPALTDAPKQAVPDDIDSHIALLLQATAPDHRHSAFAPIAPDDTATTPGPQEPPAPRGPGRLRAWIRDRLGPTGRGSSGGFSRLGDPDKLSVVLAGAHVLLLVAALHGLSGGAGYGVAGWILAFLAFGIWFGQVSNSNAHELIHRRDRRLRALGAGIYVTMLFGHHASAHRLVHHRFVATMDDPNTAQLGESFYHFVLRAWPGSFLAGYEMEAAIRQRRATRRRIPPVHPYVWYLAGSALTALLVVALFGVAGFLAWILLAGYVQLQLLMSDYVQHYGLRRRALSLGTVEPLGPRHSWDAPTPFSSALMLNAPRHADHHLHPDRPWSELEGGKAPVLPHSLPVMGAIALWPGRWRRLMDKRVKAATRAA